MINYYLLMKPGIILGNLITVAAGFLLASRGQLDFGLFLMTLLGIALIMGSGCVFNNFIDLERDRKMKRTQNRALVMGVVSAYQAIIFAVVLLMLGNVVLGLFTNIRALVLADLGFFIYVVLYSLWKGKTIYGTAIGSLAGAIPPVVGYCAVSNSFDAGAWILFFMLVLWQMPHFFSIAILHLEDYAAAKIPALPLLKGLHRTKIHMALYIVAFNFTAMLLTFFGYTGWIYLAVAMLMGLVWLVLCLKGFSETNELAWSRKMFQWSLVLILAVCLVIPFDLIH